MTRSSALLRCERGAAGAEMALVLPLLLVLMFSAFELGNYFRDWHTLSKSVRDGARFAARHDFGDFDCAAEAEADDVATATKEATEEVATSCRTGTVPSSHFRLPARPAWFPEQTPKATPSARISPASIAAPKRVHQS
jgi:Flp pilus assembly protein TadG